MVNDGSGWHEDEGADALLGSDAVPWAVAALPDGGAAFTAKSATGGATIYERDSAGAPWQAVPYPGGLTPGYLTLFREGGALRAIGTSSEPATFTAEEESPPPPGFPPIRVDPYPLPNDLNRGVLRQTASGWNDEEHELNDAREPPGGYSVWDTPKIPDPVNALLVDPTGTQGWAVGGVVDNKHALLDTSDIYRYPSTAGSALDAHVPEGTRSGYAAIAIGGGAACAAPCASRADTGVGPVVSLAHAIAEAGELVAPRGRAESVGAFVYTGPGVTTGQTAGPQLFPVPWKEEESYYATRAAGGRPPVCVAPSPSDREGHGEGSAGAFEAAFGTSGGCGGVPSGSSYAFEKQGLRVVVLDTSLVHAGQRVLAPEELTFLRAQLAEAAGHAIVVGNADLPQEYAEGRPAARELVAAIESGKAAAYFFDSPEQNVKETLTGAASSTEAFGSGTLGYVNVLGEEKGGGFIGQSGFLLAEISNSERDKYGRYARTVRLVPDVEELALEAQQGTLLRRSQVASFAGLARRPRAGNRSRNTVTEFEVAPYVQIPANCVGAGCERGIAPEYRFTSSDPHYGQFVRRNFSSAEPNAVLHDSHGKPISQEAEGGKDGLFCAYNATPRGKPIEVTLETGNLRYSVPVTIQAGSVRQPCGTTALAAKPAVAEASVAPPPASQGPPANSAAPTSVNVPLPAAPAPAAAPAAGAARAAPPVPAPAGTRGVPAGVRAGAAADARPAHAAQRYLCSDLARGGRAEGRRRGGGAGVGGRRGLRLPPQRTRNPARLSARPGRAGGVRGRFAARPPRAAAEGPRGARDGELEPRPKALGARTGSRSAMASLTARSPFDYSLVLRSRDDRRRRRGGPTARRPRRGPGWPHAWKHPPQPRDDRSPMSPRPTVLPRLLALLVLLTLAALACSARRPGRHDTVGRPRTLRRIGKRTQAPGTGPRREPGRRQRLGGRR